MKKIIALIPILLLAATAHAQQLMVATSLAANVSSNILAAASIIDNLTILNATTNIATVKFYDSSTTDTNYVQAANITFSSYSTNFSVVWTNSANVLVTNTFSGIYTAPTTNSAATNSRPAVATLIIPANSVLNKDVKIQTIRGLTAVPNQDLTCVTTYRKTE